MAFKERSNYMSFLRPRERHICGTSVTQDNQDDQIDFSSCSSSTGRSRFPCIYIWRAGAANSVLGEMSVDIHRIAQQT
jgi:hypothetical protein